MTRMLTPTQARRFYDRFGARQDSQAWYEDPAVEALLRHGRFEQAVLLRLVEPMTRMLTPTQARRFYDRFGARQDSQAWYEDPAVEALLRHGRFEQASAVFELGCGTGRLAERLLRERLPVSARYLGVDVSDTMVRLASARLTPFAGRASVRRTDGELVLAEPDGSFDRVLSTFVLDLLPDGEIERALASAHRLLAEGGLLCLAGLGCGTTPLSRVVASGWRLVHRMRPSLVGGCRPLSLLPLLDALRWQVLHHSARSTRGLPTESLVARRV